MRPSHPVQDGAESRMVEQGLHVWVGEQPVEVAIAEPRGARQHPKGGLQLIRLGEGSRESEVMMRISGSQ